MNKIYGGIEAGGTKFICIIGTAPDDIKEKIQFPTAAPAETLQKAVSFFRQNSARYPLQAIGIASFGPVDLDKGSDTYGYIINTPKPGWSHINFGGEIQQALRIPVAFDTDVNGAAFGEFTWGAARNLDSFLYITVGTGIGGGGMVNGKLLHGLGHPEMGHIRIPHDTAGDPFPGCCPYHGDCWEGLACGKAMELRYGMPAEQLPQDHPAWELEAGYLASGLGNLIHTVSPQRIILGGGLMKNPSLLPMVQQNLFQLLGNYMYSPKALARMNDYLVLPALGNLSGVLGALALAKQIGALNDVKV